MSHRSGRLFRAMTPVDDKKVHVSELVEKTISYSNFPELRERLGALFRGFGQ
jgi:hypothetical protein